MTDYELKLQQLQKEFKEINTKKANKWILLLTKKLFMILS